MAMLRPVSEMKDSGYPFMGTIPKTWKVVSINSIKDYNHPYPIGDGDHGQISPDDYQGEGIPYIRVQNLTWDGQLNLDNVVFIPEEVNNANSKSILKPNDILVAKTGATIGKTAIIPETVPMANTTSSVGKLTVSPKYSSKYVYYALSSNVCLTQMWIKAGQKTAQPGFNIVDLAAFRIPFPDVPEQHAIADYLDDRCSKLDEIVTEAEKSIEEYKELKQAVIDETVSLGCSRLRVKYIGSVQTGPFGTQLSADEYAMEGIPCINVKNIGYGYIKNENLDYLPEMVADRLSDHKLLENDIIFARKGSIDKHAIVSKRESGWVQGSDCIRLRINTSIISAEYLNYYIASTEVNKYLWLKSNGSTMPSLNSEMIKNIPIEVPDMKRQKVIVEKLREKLQAFDVIIAQKQSLIEDLKAYKKSLIYEFVTGKRRIL